MIEEFLDELPWSRQPGQALRIAVIGDIILDEYLDGQVNRISPEAPVPINHITSTSYGAGGAANAALNLKRVGAEPALLSVWATDEAAKHLAKLLKGEQVDTSHIVTVTDRPTIRKVRLTSQHHQMLRIDWEYAQPITRVIEDQLFSNLTNLDFDGLLISDYGKGVLTERLLGRIIDLARERRVPAVVDPKGADFSRYRHSTLITPNAKEAAEALGLSEEISLSGAELGQRLQERYNLEDILVTMGPRGMVYTPSGAPLGQAIEVPSVAREVYDVSGAGDTVAALMTLGLASGCKPIAAMSIATAAAGLVVEKWGTQPVNQAELLQALGDQSKSNNRRPRVTKRSGSHRTKNLDDDTTVSFSTSSKITTIKEIKSVLAQYPTDHRDLVFTNGCFDILHPGHVEYLEAARSRGDGLVVALNTDQSIKRLKGPKRPVIPLAGRLQMMAALECVDFVISFDADTPIELIKALRPQVLIKGGDYLIEDIVGAAEVLEYGGTVDTIKFVGGYSTSTLIESIQKLYTDRC